MKGCLCTGVEVLLATLKQQGATPQQQQEFLQQASALTASRAQVSHHVSHNTLEEIPLQACHVGLLNWMPMV